MWLDNPPIVIKEFFSFTLNNKKGGKKIPPGSPKKKALWAKKVGGKLKREIS